MQFFGGSFSDVDDHLSVKNPYNMTVLQLVSHCQMFCSFVSTEANSIFYINQSIIL